MLRALISALILGMTCAGFHLGADETEADPATKTPPAFEPFKHMVGPWKGQAAPADNPIRGWTETHNWSWAFDEGKPVAMTLQFEGSQVLNQAQLAFDAESKQFRLEGTDPEGKPVAFVGAIDERTNALTLDREAAGPSGEERITIRPNANKIRYTFWLDRKAPRAPQYSRVITANLGKEGVAFAAAGAAADVPECIVTGGSAALSITYQGQTYPLCCTGCREQFLESPARYVEKAKSRPTADDTPSKGVRKGADDDF
ncbi:hypothetical protein BH23PLA1_BH23PLA1_31900 [soil metagenome]